jgi:UDP-sulfoquinovose synthase
MKILVLGASGYLGWPTCTYLAAKGHEVVGIDNYWKLMLERQCGVSPLVDPGRMDERADVFLEETGINILTYNTNIHDVNAKMLEGVDAVVHYAEQPSAPYSMMGKQQCVDTQVNNVVGTLNLLWELKDTDIHLVKLGTLGEYGYGLNWPIWEGLEEIEYKGRLESIPFPKQPGSFYHASKVHDSTNIEMACRLWGLRATDLNQGIVWGTGLNTSFHYDAIFGTCLNRFITQAVAGVPLSVYGSGYQTRGWLHIRDTLRCVELALLNPAEPGEYRVFNQLTEQYSVLDLAEKVAAITGAEIAHLSNPRIEKEEHFYKVQHTALKELGLEPHLLNDELLYEMLAWVESHKDNIDEGQILPTVNWK